VTRVLGGILLVLAAAALVLDALVLDALGR
jgi:hypothetical protein